MSNDLTRRHFIGAAGIGSAAFIAGCQGAEQGGDGSASAAQSAEPTTGEVPDAADEGTLEHQTQDSSAPAVYITRDISSDGLLAAYAALGRELSGKVGVKLHTGEGANSNFLRPNLIAALVNEVGGTIVETTTAYPGSRSTADGGLKTAQDHGFAQIADVDIMDAEGTMSIPVAGGMHLSQDVVGSHFANYDSYLVLSHFKGHGMAGFGGALKNISIGFASSSGKSLIHTGGSEVTGFGWGYPANVFLESVAEAAKAVSDHMGENILYINVMNRLSIACDCEANPDEPDMADIGILASTDPVALDQACVDLVYAAADGASLVRRIEERQGIIQLEHAAAIGVGSRAYRLVSIDA